MGSAGLEGSAGGGDGADGWDIELGHDGFQ